MKPATARNLLAKSRLRTVPGTLKRILFCVPFLTLLANPSVGRSVENLTLVYPSISAVLTPVYIAKDEGVFSRFDLDVKLVYLGGTSRTTQTLISGDADLAMGSVDATAYAVLNKAEVVMIAPTYNNFIYYLVGKSGLTRLQDLKGKVVGITSFGTMSEFAARYILGQSGLAAAKDYNLLTTGGGRETLAAIIGGKIDGGILWPPLSFEAEKRGLGMVFDPTQKKLPIPSSAIVAKRAAAREKLPKLVNFLKGYREGVRIFQNDKALSIRLLSKYTRTEDADILNRTYVFTRAMIGEWTGTIPLEGIEEILKFMSANNPKVASIKASDLVDVTPMKEAMK